LSSDDDDEGNAERLPGHDDDGDAERHPGDAGDAERHLGDEDDAVAAAELTETRVVDVVDVVRPEVVIEVTEPAEDESGAP
jgi:hypothetical protein